MIDQDFLTQRISEAITEVFSTMLDMPVRFAGNAAPNQSQQLGIVSLVGLTGEWGGSCVMCCSPGSAQKLWSQMLGQDVSDSTAIDGEVLDVVAEITNMIVGSLKNSLEPVTGPMAISIPTVIHGRNFEFRNAAGAESLALRFESAEQIFEIRIAISPVPEAQAALTMGRVRIPVLGFSHA